MPRPHPPPRPAGVAAGLRRDLAIAPLKSNDVFRARCNPPITPPGCHAARPREQHAGVDAAASPRSALSWRGWCSLSLFLSLSLARSLARSLAPPLSLARSPSLASLCARVSCGSRGRCSREARATGFRSLVCLRSSVRKRSNAARLFAYRDTSLIRNRLPP